MNLQILVDVVCGLTFAGLLLQTFRVRKARLNNTMLSRRIAYTDQLLEQNDKRYQETRAIDRELLKGIGWDEGYDAGWGNAHAAAPYKTSKNPYKVAH